MQDPARRLPAPKGSLPDFAPVPRKRQRHDGWTPERQKAFIEALADTGCVTIAARMVNMTPESAYMLRRQPGAESFRRAWEAAQGLGLQVVKDEAFDRAMHGQLVPVFVAGKLMGFRRKKNDRLLMFILRHYGQDAQGRKTTINYFSTRATAAAGAAAPTNPPRNGEGDRPQGGGGGPETRSAIATAGAAAEKSSPGFSGEGDQLQAGGGAAAALAAAESSTTTVKTIISGDPGETTALARQDEAADLLDAFEGVPLDDQAKADIHRALEAAAERRRALRVDWDTPRDEALAREAADGSCAFIRVKPGGAEYLGELESGAGVEEFVPFNEGEPHWESIGEPMPEWYSQWLEEQEAKAKTLPAPLIPPRDGEGDHAKHGGGGAEPSPAPQPLPSPGPESPAPSPRKRYKARKPKPPFTPLVPGEDKAAYQARKANAAAEVEAERARRRKPVDRRRKENRTKS